ncbi:HU family DNA-binding protein [uncultured Mailhella sp.]|uniref:HU family DNA-binding protein n=1 Tax=uncultured Mailhella sp. TaxID=1981031 RepID=UPI002609C60D|nr:HU family DNA-binding protein [uncultured Mailhella sp.]
MTKAELIAKIAEKSSISRVNAEQVLNAMLDAMKETLVAEGRISFPGFGSLLVQERKERKGHNPRTGETITIPASKTIVFRASDNLKKKVH